jgi:drug/metabolite transporter (DMT)-like permease
LKKINLNNPLLNYVFMTASVIFFAMEFVIAKPMLQYVPELTLIWMKYILALIALVSVKFAVNRRWPFSVRDIPYFILLAVFGEVFYLYSSYSAIKLLPIALVTIVMSLAPVLSIGFERFIYKRRARFPALIGTAISIFGISMVVGVDTEMLAGGRFAGYLWAFATIVSANLYNVVAIKLAERYSTFDIAVYNVIASVILCTPFALNSLPSAQVFNVSFVLTIVFLGVVVGAFGVFAYVNAVNAIGPTSTLMFSNFMPVVACLFGWVRLGEMILPLQLLGGAITLAGCATVIWFLGKAGPVTRL